jgi:hypothetical protein
MPDGGDVHRRRRRRVLLDRHAQGIEHSRDHRVEARSDHQLDPLPVGEVPGELLMDVAVDVSGQYRVGQHQRSPFLLREAAGGLPRRDRVDLLGGRPGPVGHVLVLVPLVVGAHDVRRTQDHEFAQQTGGRALVADRPGELQPGVEHVRCVREGPVQVELTGPELGDLLCGGGVWFLQGQGVACCS